MACAVKHSPWSDYAEDIVATSGFAFRMWVSADLCTSATSIWEFKRQKNWVENGGLICEFVGRFWNQEHKEEAKRLEAIEKIKASIDNGIPAISWDIGVPEWGLVIGYDDDAQLFDTLAINGKKETMPYPVLGKREIPILNVLTITGCSDKSKDEMLLDTMKLAVQHLRGHEWCDNAKGLDAYPALIKIFEAHPEIAASWNAEYFLGTYGALKEYACLYFEKYGKSELAELYRTVFNCWMEAFTIKKNEDATSSDVRAKIVSLLQSAYDCEQEAVRIMESLTA